jgi:hypothetical protein
MELHQSGGGGRRMNGGLSFRPVADGQGIGIFHDILIFGKKGTPFDIFLCRPLGRIKCNRRAADSI